jgi:WD40 repeat protein
VLRWPVDCERAGAVTVGPPAELPCTSQAAQARVRGDGRVLAGIRPGGSVLVADLTGRKEDVLLAGYPNLATVSFHPEKPWLATGNWHAHHVKVWDTDTGKVVWETRREDSASVEFSPDGRWLVTSTGNDFVFREPGTWRRSHRTARDRAGDMPGLMAFTRDGRLMAGALSRFVVALIDPADGGVLATLETPGLDHLSGLAFSPDARYLVATYESDLLRIWDLHAIGAGLARSKLDRGWPLPTAAPEPLSPLAVRVRLNELTPVAGKPPAR